MNLTKLTIMIFLTKLRVLNLMYLIDRTILKFGLNLFFQKSECMHRVICEYMIRSARILMLMSHEKLPSIFTHLDLFLGPK